MLKRALRAYALTMAAATSLIALPSPWDGKAAAAGADIQRNFELFRDVLDEVRANYVVKPDDSKLLEDAIKGVVKGLGPHSPSFSVKAFEEQKATRGRLIALSSLRQGKAAAAGADIHYVLKQVRANYAVKPDDSKLLEDAIRGVLTGLDPHST